ncbi:MAG: hypothetical protein C0605_17300 [Hyphomicrobiales bacterium]|nr:MAG: hypothetical protein C0605_17300 [Hyphomicrobiales bacterium]
MRQFLDQAHLRGIWLPALLAAALLGLPFASIAAESTGDDAAQVRVIDGDTVQIGSKTFDLRGIDAPELGQICLNGSVPWHCGLDAAYALVKRFVFDPPHCRPADAPEAGADRPGQVVCTTGGLAAASVMLEDGYAEATKQAGLEYLRVQKQARKASLGIWRGKYVDPVRWRAGERLPEEAGHAPACPVKAVHLPGGAKVYYVPFDPEFPSRVIDPQKGDRCFGSDEAARNAGYLRPAAQ